MILRPRTPSFLKVLMLYYLGKLHRGPETVIKTKVFLVGFIFVAKCYACTNDLLLGAKHVFRARNVIGDL